MRRKGGKKGRKKKDVNADVESAALTPAAPPGSTRILRWVFQETRSHLDEISA
jgi:hypothetical protein